MKKLYIALSIAALTASVYAGCETSAATEACGTNKACAVKQTCPACTKAGGMCAACKAKADAAKAAEEKTECAGGVCPLKK